MNYAAADASPRSVIAYTAAPVFLAIVVNRVIAVIRDASSVELRDRRLAELLA